ncbi:MAG: hypothetical protein ACLQEQ_02600 [Nitrososphaerales archaeon]
MTAVVPLDPGTKRVFSIVAWVSFIALLILTIYGVAESLLRPDLAVGATWVDVYWPFPPYFAQPVTYFSVACIALFYSGLRLWEVRISKWPLGLITFLQLVGFIVAFSSAYEVLYNFNFWGATYTVAALQKNVSIPDLLNSSYPIPWSFVFATRAFSALFVISGYSVYFLRRLNRSHVI